MLGLSESFFASKSLTLAAAAIAFLAAAGLLTIIFRFAFRREATSAEVSQWVQTINGGWSRGRVLAFFAEHESHRAFTDPTIALGFDFEEWVGGGLFSLLPSVEEPVPMQRRRASTKPACCRSKRTRCCGSREAWRPTGAAFASRSAMPTSTVRGG